MKEEIWKDVVGYEGIYQVSNLGRIKSLKRKGKIKNTQLDKDGYEHLSLWHNSKAKRMSVHRIVAQAFIPNPENKPVVNHIDGNKTNNIVNNLEWCTRSENDIHAYKLGLRKVNKTGTGKFSKLNGHSRKVYMLNKETQEIMQKFDSLADAGRYLKRKPNQMGSIAAQIRGERKTAYGYKWRYVNETDD